MAFPGSIRPPRRLRRILLTRLLWVAVPLAALGCDDASDPVGPAPEAEAVTSLVTGDRLAFISWQNGSPDVYKMDPREAAECCSRRVPRPRI